MQKKSSGFFLIESLFASAILSLFMITVFQVLLVKINRSNYSQAQDEAVFLIEENLLESLFNPKKNEPFSEPSLTKITEKNFKDSIDLARDKFKDEKEKEKTAVFDAVKKELKIVSAQKNEKIANKDLIVSLHTFATIELDAKNNLQKD